jgi:DNA mismatch repair protein MutL
MSIRILPPELINQIAAGEVVERPASVIKELVENSMDAGSSVIDVFVRDGGLTHIGVKDNGTGMAKDDLELCIQRHATSKLIGKNLLDILSYGFRGEALPSICSISRTCIRSKRSEDLSGWLLKVENGEITELSPTQCDVGTFISVDDLFYTTPVRLKFLKAVSTELSYSMQAVKVLALSNYAVAVSFTNGKHRSFEYKKADSLEQRIIDVLGGEFFENGVVFAAECNSMKLNGWFGFPTYRSKTIAYSFVNGRPVKDRFLAMAVKTAYQEVIIPGEQPSFVIYITLDPQEVDVNVHPAKTEVRFRDQNKVRSFIIGSIQEKLKKHSQYTSPGIVDRVFKYSVPEGGQRSIQTAPSASANQAALKKDYAFVSSEEKLGGGDSGVSIFPIFAATATERTGHDDPELLHRKSPRDKLYGIVFSANTLEKPPAPSNLSSFNDANTAMDFGTAKAQIFSSYVISQNEDAIFIIDQHAVHERIVYENIKKNVRLDENGWIESSLPVQKLLMAEVIALSDKEALAILEYIPYIIKLGFKVVLDGQKLEILEIPQLFAESNVLNLVRHIIDEFIDYGISESFLAKVHKIFADHACHNSVRANHSLSFDEMDALLRTIEETDRIGQCNHGRPSYIKLSRTHIERLFERG